MKTASQEAGSTAAGRTKRARVRAGVALVAGALMVLGATQTIDTTAAMTDSVAVNSGELKLDANLLPRSQFINCVDRSSSAPNTQSTVTWRHLGPGYTYRLEIRWPDGTLRHPGSGDSLITAPGAGAARNSIVTYQVNAGIVDAAGALGRNMTLRIFPVLNGVVGTNWVGNFLHLGSGSHMYCNGATWGTGPGAHPYPTNLFSPGSGTPLARSVQQSDDEKPATDTSTPLTSPNEVDAGTATATTVPASPAPSTTGPTMSASPAPEPPPSSTTAPATAAPSNTESAVPAPSTTTPEAMPAPSDPTQTTGPIATSDSGAYTAARSVEDSSLIITDPAGTHDVGVTISPEAVLTWDGDVLVVVEGEQQKRFSKSSGEWKVAE